MFENAAEMLETSRSHLDDLREAVSDREVANRLNAFVAAAQGVPIALLREGRGERLSGFNAWYEALRQRMDDDDVMIIVREARDHDFEDGEHRLRYVNAPAPLMKDDTGRSPKPGAWWPLPNAPSVHVAIDNAPETHRGKPLTESDPYTVCRLALGFLDGSLADAKACVGR